MKELKAKLDKEDLEKLEAFHEEHKEVKIVIDEAIETNIAS